MPSIYLDLDSTLILSLGFSAACADLRLLFGDESESLPPGHLLARLDARVAGEMKGCEGLAFPELYARRLAAESEVKTRLLEEQGLHRLRVPGLHRDGLVVLVRPGLREFLIELEKWGDIHLCTGSGRVYANACLEMAGVRDFFHTLVTCEDLEGDPAPAARFLLVDDLPHHDVLTLRKLRYLGAPRVEETSGEHPNCHRIRAFSGSKQDRELQRTLPLLLPRLRELS